MKYLKLITQQLLYIKFKNDIGFCIYSNEKKVNLKEVECRQLITKLLFDIITLIGTQGLSYWGKDDAIYNKHNICVIHL